MAARRMVMVVTDADGQVLSERTAEGGSNNIAELEAVHDAVTYAYAQGFDALEVRTDSRNNLAWVHGSRVGKHINDRARVLLVKSLIDQMRTSLRLTLVWVPRDENKAGHYIEGRYGL